MVEIAKALSLNPKILVLDEPTAVLDDKAARILFQVLRRLREQNLGIVYICWFMKQLEMTAERLPCGYEILVGKGILKKYLSR
jgi:ABC-type sugar transport system ATPase subunit